MAQKIAFTRVVEYRANGITISFVPKSDVPGFTHAVLIIHAPSRHLIARDWLSKGFAVSEKAAEFFYEKHEEKIACAGDL